MRESRHDLRAASPTPSPPARRRGSRRRLDEDRLQRRPRLCARAPRDPPAGPGGHRQDRLSAPAGGPAPAHRLERHRDPRRALADLRLLLRHRPALHRPRPGAGPHGAAAHHLRRSGAGARGVRGLQAPPGRRSHLQPPAHRGGDLQPLRGVPAADRPHRRARARRRTAAQRRLRAHRQRAGQRRRHRPPAVRRPGATRLRRRPAPWPRTPPARLGRAAHGGLPPGARPPRDRPGLRPRTRGRELASHRRAPRRPRPVRGAPGGGRHRVRQRRARPGSARRAPGPRPPRAAGGRGGRLRRLPDAPFAYPSLSSISPDKTFLARLALDMLGERIAGYEGPPRMVTAPYQLIARDSSAAAR